MGPSVVKHNRALSLDFRFAPGDTVVLTGLVRDIKQTYPDQVILVNCHHGELFKFNPYTKHRDTWTGPPPQPVNLNYGQELNNHHKETIHYLAALHRIFERQTGLHVPVLQPRGDLHFGDAEASRIVSGRYWAIWPGGKTDMPVKMWDPGRWQVVVDELRTQGLGVVQLGDTGGMNIAVPLHNTLDLTGRTTLRDVMRITRDADGVICGVSFPMHLAAALERPCVVLAGGRETWTWEAYHPANRGFLGAESQIRVPHHFLHTIGLLDCCKNHGCMRRNLQPKDNGGRNCTHLFQAERSVIPECMAQVSPAHVLDAIVSFYLSGMLPPVEEPKDGRIHGQESAAGR